MCGRATYKLTWEEIVALYRLTLDQPFASMRVHREIKREIGCLTRAMFDVGYFPPNTPPDEWISFNGISPS